MLDDVSIRTKVLFGSGLLLAAVTAESGLELTGSDSKGLAAVLLVLAWVLGGGAMLLVLTRLSAAVKQLVARGDGCTHAVHNDLLKGLQALASGDLTVELHARQPRP